MAWHADTTDRINAPTPAASTPLPAMAATLRHAAHAIDPAHRLALGMADAVSVLVTEFHRFDAADPRWPDRDRLVVSPSHGAPLLRALLDLTGHADQAGDAGHPAAEASTGPLGQGFAMAVGMALAERLLAARFGKSLVDHRTWVIATLGDLMEGVSHEAASLAGHLRLEKLLVLLEDDSDCPFCVSGLAGPDDALRRFAALGWATRSVAADDPAAIASALSLSLRSRKPTLIACRTGRTGDVAPAGDGAALWADAGRRGSTARRAWLKRLAHHPQRAEFERVMAGRLPDGWTDQLATVKAALAADRAAASTRQSAERLLEAMAPSIPELVGGQTELGPSRGAPVTPGSFSGRQVHYGAREQGMAACLNGLSLHGGLLPYAAATLVGTDAMRPALRLSAMMGVRAIYVATHDSGGADQGSPVEQLASLRAMPGLMVLRPADAIETAECCELAVRRTTGPTMLVLSDQALPALRGDAGENRCARGAYVLAEANGPRAATLIASGSDVALAMAARDLLAADGLAVAVVSMPGWALFARAPAGVQAVILGSAPRFGIEAACGFGWERWLGPDGVFLGLDGFGAPLLTPDQIAGSVRRRLKLERTAETLRREADIHRRG